MFSKGTKKSSVVPTNNQVIDTGAGVIPIHNIKSISPSKKTKMTLSKTSKFLDSLDSGLRFVAKIATKSDIHPHRIPPPTLPSLSRDLKNLYKALEEERDQVLITMAKKDEAWTIINQELINCIEHQDKEIDKLFKRETNLNQDYNCIKLEMEYLERELDLLRNK